MSALSCLSPTHPKRLVGAIAALGTALLASQAIASPQGDVLNLLNAAHMAAGCPAYETAGPLGDVALQFAQSMVDNNGRTQTTSFRVNADELLSQRGYFPSSWGEMDYFNPNGGGSPQSAVSFWQSKNTNALITNCGITQVGVAVWINGQRWASSVIMGTPGEKPAEGPAPVVK